MGLVARASSWLKGRASRSVRHAQELRALLPPALWTPDRADTAGGRLRLGGWAIPPEGNPSGITFAVNGRRCDHVKTGLPRPDLPAVFGFVPGVEFAGFEADAELTADEREGATAILFDAVDSGTLRAFSPWQQMATLPAHLERWPLPDAARIRRVHGTPDPEAFRLVGYSNHQKLQRVLRDVVKRPLDSFEHILDWGCGSGRLLRYLSSVRPGALTGADIDADNLAWCRENLPFAHYCHLPLHPPSPLPALGFDLILGLSIFTHLNASVQDEWLVELQRVSAPGAILLMSIHGPTVHAMTRSVEFCRSLQATGIFDGHSHDLDDVLEDKSYYRTTYHAHSYIRSHWSQYFEVLDILPACIGNAQDLVVMRRR